MSQSNAESIVALQSRLHAVESEMARRVQEMDALYSAGIALSSQTDLRTLYGLILETGCALTGADAGTLYLTDRADDRRVLVFAATHNASIELPFEQQVMPLSAKSIAGSVAISGVPLSIDDAYRLPAGSTFGFDRSFDQTSGYRTRSILAVPMTTVDGRVVGVLQLINRKHDSAAVLTNAAVVERAVGAFDAEDERIALALASQAAVAVENRRLMETDRLYQALQEYVREVGKVIVAAGEVEAGEFEPDSLDAVADRDDALGQLARVFQRMAREVYAREARLREQVQQLRIEIDSARKASQVAAITGTDYFQDLKRAARELRDER